MVRSTQTVEQNATDTTGSGAGGRVGRQRPAQCRQRRAAATASKSASGRTEETTNYEISKTVTTTTQDGGDVKHLSVAVVVDGTVTGDGANAPYKPRTAAEMTQITNLVKSAMGFDQARGDQVQVTNMHFARVDAGDGTPAAKPLLGLDAAYWFKIIEAAIMCVTALLIGLFVARPLISRMFAPNPPSQPQPTQLAGASPVAGALPAPGARPAGGSDASGAAPLRVLPAQPGIDHQPIEGQVRESSIKKIGEVVNAHPEEALAIIRTWLHQPV